MCDTQLCVLDSVCYEVTQTFVRLVQLKVEPNNYWRAKEGISDVDFVRSKTELEKKSIPFYPLQMADSRIRYAPLTILVLLTLELEWVFRHPSLI